MKRFVSVTLVLFGMILGCGAAAVAPIARSWASPPGGHWECFVVDRFPDIEDARTWSGAANVTAGLNKVATQVASGTILNLTPKSGGAASVACVKY